MASAAANSTAGQWHATCLVVPAADSEACSRAEVEQLAASLARRGLTIVRAANCFDAMAELVVHERGRRGGRTHDPLVVILVDAPEQPGAAGFFQAAMKHGPSTVFWEFCASPTMRLTAYRPSAAPVPEVQLNLTPPPTPIVARGVTVARAPERHPLRLTHEAEVEAIPLRMVSPPAEDAEHAASAALLTDEELSMLLGEEPGEGWSGGTRA